MKTARLFVVLAAIACFCSSAVYAQTAPWEYTRDTPVPIVDFGTATSSITITDNFSISSMEVLVDIQHSAAGDLMLVLSGPYGTFILSQYNGGLSENYQNTIFDQTVTSGTAIPGKAINDPSNANAYFRGIYKPQPGTTFPTGVPGAGTWTLQVYDNMPGDNGVLRKWSLLFNTVAKYKDVRWGVDLNYLGTATRYPAPWVEDMTAFSPVGLYPYRVLGYRPMANTAMFHGLIQNSKTASTTRITASTAAPGQPFQFLGEGDFGLNMQATYISLGAMLPNVPGNYGVRMDLYQRGDLFASRNDNRVEKTYQLTPGTLGYDNGKAAGSTNIPFNNCEASVFNIAVAQTLTSVDVWQGSGVELEPLASPARLTVRVWDASTGTPTTQVASSGLRMLPTQGGKWVTYEFNPPVTLQAGSYAFGMCTNVAPIAGGTSLGVDREGSPFDMEGTYSRYYNLGVEFFSMDNAATWNPEMFRMYGGKMIRPNFVTGSDVGIVSIDYPPANLPASFAPAVTFASYANHPSLPNLIALAKVSVIDNATNQVVRYSERRVFMQNVPFSTSVTFDTFSGLAAGTYTIKVDLERSDDENLANNTYSRTYTKTFAPVTVSHNGPLADNLRNEILRACSGSQVVFTDRMQNGVTLPQNGNVLWVGDITSTDASAVRSYVEAGNVFSMIPSTLKGDVLTSVYASLADSRELKQMNDAIMTTKTVRPELQPMTPATESMLRSSIRMNDPSDLEQSISMLKQRQNAAMSLAKGGVDVREAGFSQNENLTVTGDRIGSLSIVRVLATHAKPQQQVVQETAAPSEFALAQNYPNPFNPTTNISYMLQTDASVSLRVYDMLGREVATIVNGAQNAGRYIATWDGLDNTGRSVSSGVYLYRLEAAPLAGGASFIMAKRMVLAR